MPVFDLLALEINTGPHDLNSSLTRVLIISNYAITGGAPREEVAKRFEHVSGVDSVIHVGRQSIELYVLHGNLPITLGNLVSVFSGEAERVGTRLRSIVFNGAPYRRQEFVSHTARIVAMDAADKD